MSCLDDDCIASFVDGSLDEETCVEVQTHLDDCAACMELVRALVETYQLSPPTEDAPASLPSFLAAGTRIGRYVVLHRIGAGGMGVVYLGYDPELDRKIALKLVRGHSDADPARQAQLAREAQALARLSDPHVVTVYDVGQWAGAIFLAMEHIDGSAIDLWLARMPDADWRQIVEAFVAAGRGLEAAHRAGLVHGDVKPANMLRGSDGRVRITDFGLARAQREPTARRSGTPAYMAPEQLAGEPADARADQYSFCIALYQALTGQHPTDRPTRARPATVAPTHVMTALAQGMSQRPDARHPSMAALLDALGHDPRRRRRILALAAVPLVAIALAAGLETRRAQQRRQSCEDEGSAIAAVWSVPRRAAVTQAFVATGKPYAADAAQRAIAAIDAYTTRWTEARRQSCQSTLVDGLQSHELLALRRQCLDDRRESLSQVADLLSLADAAVVVRSPDMIELLPPLDACADVDALRVKAADNPPEARVLQRRLDLAASQLAAGQVRAASTAAEALLLEARQLNRPRLVAEAALFAGKARYVNGHFATAFPLLSEAAWASYAAHDDRGMLDACLLAGMASLTRNGADAAEPWLACSRAGFARVGGKAPAAALNLANLEANYAERTQKLADGTELRKRAISACEAQEGVNSPHLITPLVNLATALGERGLSAEAMAPARRAVALAETLLGPAHPRTGKARLVLGSTLGQRSELPEARRELEHALAILRPELGPDSLELLSAEHELAGVRSDLGELDAAVADYRHVIASYARIIGVRSLDYGIARLNLGLVHNQRHDYKTAIAELEAALPVVEAQTGEGPQVASGLIGLATAQLARGDRAAAAASAARAEKILSKAGAAADLAEAKQLLARAR